jgi:hypothetical protein
MIEARKYSLMELLCASHMAENCPHVASPAEIELPHGNLDSRCRALREIARKLSTLRLDVHNV